MTRFSTKSLSHLKKLSRIHCSPEEEEKILESLSTILESMESLQEVDTEGVAPCRYPLKELSSQTLRSDTYHPTLPREIYLCNTAKHTGGMVTVPPVLKGN